MLLEPDSTGSGSISPSSRVHFLAVQGIRESAPRGIHVHLPLVHKRADWSGVNSSVPGSGIVSLVDLNGCYGWRQPQHANDRVDHRDMFTGSFV